MSDPERLADDELAIYISSTDRFRVLIPNSWTSETNITEFAYLALAAVLRLARRDEKSFAQELAQWAQENVQDTATGHIDFSPKPKKPN